MVLQTNFPLDLSMDLFTPENLFGEFYPTVLNLLVEHSPFPGGQGNLFSRTAKLRAARIHLQETVFFAQVAFRELNPQKSVEVCAGIGIPSITLKKLFNVDSICVDRDSRKTAIGKVISEKIGIELIWEEKDLFLFLRQNAPYLKGATLLATAAYCHDKKKGKPKGSGEKDLVYFAKNHQMDLALFPYRTRDIISRGFSSEKQRVDEYQKILTEAGYQVKIHSTRSIFQGQNAPDWFFVNFLTAKSPNSEAKN